MPPPPQAHLRCHLGRSTVWRRFRTQWARWRSHLLWSGDLGCLAEAKVRWISGENPGFERKDGVPLKWLVVKKDEFFFVFFSSKNVLIVSNIILVYFFVNLAKMGGWEIMVLSERLVKIQWCFFLVHHILMERNGNPSRNRDCDGVRCWFNLEKKQVYQDSAAEDVIR